MRVRENGRRNDAPDLEPVFRGAIILLYYIFLRDFGYIYLIILYAYILSFIRTFGPET